MKSLSFFDSYTVEENPKRSFTPGAHYGQCDNDSSYKFTQMSSIRKDWHFGQDPRVQLSHDLSPTVKLSDSKGGDPPAVLRQLDCRRRPMLEFYSRGSRLTIGPFGQGPRVELSDNNGGEVALA